LEALTDPAAGQPVEYPYSDGKVLMETDPHARSIIDMRDQLDTHFKARQDAYVAGSMALYYRQGDPAAVVVPDVFVVLGAVHKQARKSYLLWEEGGVVPSFVVEVASRSTGRRDATSKRATYERMGVLEYWRFDPLGELIAGRLEGWRLTGGRYERVRAVRAGGWHRSEALGLELRAEGRLLRFWDPQTGRALVTHSESQRASRALERERARAVRELDATTRKLDATTQELDATERERDAANQRIRELEARLRLSDKSG
jgi:Uma2 family endonuclease